MAVHNRPDDYSQSALTSTKVAHETITMLDAARAIIRGPSLNRTKTAGYDVKEGERVLLVEKTTDDPQVTEALVTAMREAGAQVDVVHIEVQDRPLEYADEFRGLMHNVPDIPRDPNFELWHAKLKWLERVAEEEGYSLLIQGKSGPLPKLENVRYEGAPWHHRSTFPAAAFPWPLWDLINEKAWRPIWNKGQGATVRLTDPEGTDLTYTLNPQAWDPEHYEQTGSRRRFQEQYYLAHMYGYPTPPYTSYPDVNGVAAGTLNHFGKPFPHCTVRIESGKVVDVEGGGEYGEMWRRAMDLTKDIQYPEFPDKGLFWMWEVAIGSHPKMVRPSYAFTLSGQAAMYERLRSGYIHIGMGTANGNPQEKWAEERQLPWGHLHVHCLFPTYRLHTVDGEEITVISEGRLTALDDPEVRRMAERYGDPDELLSEAWTPPIPGISVPGDYWRDYAPDPAAWLDSYDKQQQESGQ